jgi:Chaperone for protein-folding within the ER, fungal
MTPFGDGFQQVQDPCGAVSNFVQPYNETEYYQSWQIFQDPVTGYKLHLFQWDGTPVAPQFQVSSTPNMLPTQLLRNVTPSSVGASPTGGFTTQGDIALSGNARRKWSSTPGVLVAFVAIGLGVLSLVV